MDTKALQQAEEAVKVAVAEYEKLVAARTHYDEDIADAKETALEARKKLIALHKANLGEVASGLMGSISHRGRPRRQGAPGVTTIDAGGSGKKRGRPKGMIKAKA